MVIDVGAPPTTAEAIAPEAVWLDAGVSLPPSGYEVGFLSAAHTPAHVDRLLEVLFPEAA